MNRLLLALLVSFLALPPIAPAVADPCGMVPPVSLQDASAITRVGAQRTYVFYKDGVETFVIRPGFSGKADEFGMLIPFPTPPAVRKVPDDIFTHVAKAIDPPEVLVYVARPRTYYSRGGTYSARGYHAHSAPYSLRLKPDEVRVVREEAIGMYEVAVLEAGSAAALKRWMKQHAYRFPKGMDNVCNEYIEQRWCFVAVKAKVGRKAGVDPKPGMRETNGRLPKGAGFDGYVQAMGFRFRVNELVVPMRLSAFNAGELHNIVYLLTDGPRKIRNIPEEYVVRQISGEKLFSNVTGLLPVRVVGGNAAQISAARWASIKPRRDPAPHNGNAKELFAADLLSAKTGRMSHRHEEDEKALLRIGERLDLRGGDIDKLNAVRLKRRREAALKDALVDLKKMTLTIVDGDFPRQVLASQNLRFAAFRMPEKRNTARVYDARTAVGASKSAGTVYETAPYYYDWRRRYIPPTIVPQRTGPKSPLTPPTSASPAPQSNAPKSAPKPKRRHGGFKSSFLGSPKLGLVLFVAALLGACLCRRRRTTPLQ